MTIDAGQDPEDLLAKLHGNTAGAITQIEARISVGRKLLDVSALPELQTKRHDWHDGNRALFESLFPNDDIAKRLESIVIGSADFSSTTTASEIRELKELIRWEIQELESIRGQLSLNEDSE
ncbi:MAG: hypothetical protein IH872_00935 [Chloroflexi bacterium]|nr:hypothetical protein [Chloroflexota bacterium]